MSSQLGERWQSPTQLASIVDELELALTRESGHGSRSVSCSDATALDLVEPPD